MQRKHILFTIIIIATFILSACATSPTATTVVTEAPPVVQPTQAPVTATNHGTYRGTDHSTYHGTCREESSHIHLDAGIRYPQPDLYQYVVRLRRLSCIFVLSMDV